jgi:5-methylthioribose kinase
LSKTNVLDYLRERGVIGTDVSARISELSGGISNTVIGVRWDGGAVVAKQSLPELRVSEEWEFDPRRIVVEARCMAELGEILKPGEVPELLDLDEENLAFVMTYAPPGGHVWKERLLAGEVDTDVAASAGDLLGRIHRGSRLHPDLAGRFADLMPLVQGRVEPYHRTAALAHPDLARWIEEDIQRLITNRRTLVIGDFSPKNLLVYPDRVLALDFEVAHWGDPSFDTAFLLTHLVAKTIHMPNRAGQLLGAAQAFWSAYEASAKGAGASDADTSAELGMLMLCRADGKSRLEYLSTAEQDQLRHLARSMITGHRRPTTEALDWVAGEVSSWGQAA